MLGIWDFRLPLYGGGGPWCITGRNESSHGYTRMLEERYLIWRFKHGSAEAFERIYERHKNGLFKLAVGGTYTADCVQRAPIGFCGPTVRVSY